LHVALCEKVLQANTQLQIVALKGVPGFGDRWAVFILCVPVDHNRLRDEH